MKAKKSLGQNFLKSSMVLGKIIQAGEVSADDVILEIGPGRGTLTEKLLEKSKNVIAVEKDDELVEILKNKFSKEIKSGAFVLVHDDILGFDISKLEVAKYKIIANIPYNITGAILKKFLTAEHQPESMVLMVQHEVARRIVAGDKKESILSISVKAYGTPKMITKVPARYFSPKPKVDSAVITINSISRKIFSTKGGSASGGKDTELDEGKFWQVVHTGFAHKRKKLSNNLKNILPAQKNEFFGPFADKRAEDLMLADWILLASQLTI